MRNNSQRLSLISALSWIVGSTLIISGSGHALFNYFLHGNKAAAQSKLLKITSLIQTGPQKEALRSEYLEELIGLSKDYPHLISHFDRKKAERALLASPLVQEAHVEIIKPSTVYIDYTVRQPLAWLYDYENIALDKEGYLIPMYPFFPPKNLPEIYLGLAPFGQRTPIPHLPIAAWNQPLKGPAVDLAFDLLSRLQPLARDLFRIKRIDVSKAFEESLGRRELVVIVDNEIFFSSEPIISTHYLRLSVKEYPQELGNYLELRKNLLEQDMQKLQAGDPSDRVSLPEKIIDLRISQLAYIDQK
ncbi:MAG: hypothetical protein NTX49_07315 [Chlamydiae bacterium]|nr:hypothetical protein [Chlamydiota bacterium]